MIAGKQLDTLRLYCSFTKGVENVHLNAHIELVNIEKFPTVKDHEFWVAQCSPGIHK